MDGPPHGGTKEKVKKIEVFKYGKCFRDVSYYVIIIVAQFILWRRGMEYLVGDFCVAAASTG